MPVCFRDDDKQEVVPHFLFQNTHTVSGLGGGGRTAGYLHVCAEQDLDAAMSYCARPAMQCAQMRELRHGGAACRHPNG